MKEEKISKARKEKTSKAVANSQNKINAIHSSLKTFDSEYKKLLKKLKKSGVDVKSDAVTLRTLHTMLKTTISMVPIAEEQYKKYPNQMNAFSYTGLVQKTVELMDAIRSIADLSSQVDHIQNDIVYNSIRYIVQNLAEELQEVKRWGKLELNKKDSNRLNIKLDSMLRNHGVYIKEVLAKIENDLNKYMMELK